MLWLATPSIERVPLQEKHLAAELGVNDATLWRWKQLPGFQQEVQAIIHANMGDVLHDVVYSFKAEAKKGSFQHQKMYFDMMGFYKEKWDGELQVTGDLNHTHDLTNLSNEELAVLENTIGKIKGSIAP
jgi:hypothetical protein